MRVFLRFNICYQILEGGGGNISSVQNVLNFKVPGSKTEHVVRLYLRSKHHAMNMCKTVAVSIISRILNLGTE
jgi:hypothetical protein